jgi:hypothetical protein
METSAVFFHPSTLAQSRAGSCASSMASKIY